MFYGWLQYNNIFATEGFGRGRCKAMVWFEHLCIGPDSLDTCRICSPSASSKTFPTEGKAGQQLPKPAIQGQGGARFREDSVLLVALILGLRHLYMRNRSRGSRSNAFVHLRYPSTRLEP